MAQYEQVLAAVDPMIPPHDNCATPMMDLGTSLTQRASAQVNVAHAWMINGESMLGDGRFRLSQTGS
jgi:hypothetical protein